LPTHHQLSAGNLLALSYTWSSLVKFEAAICKLQLWRYLDYPFANPARAHRILVRFPHLILFLQLIWALLQQVGLTLVLTFPRSLLKEVIQPAPQIPLEFLDFPRAIHQFAKVQFLLLVAIQLTPQDHR
jgi:hypothetical protein